jgi:hypothetical protein
MSKDDPDKQKETISYSKFTREKSSKTININVRCSVHVYGKFSRFTCQTSILHTESFLLERFCNKHRQVKRRQKLHDLFTPGDFTFADLSVSIPQGQIFHTDCFISLFVLSYSIDCISPDSNVHSNNYDINHIDNGKIL